MQPFWPYSISENRDASIIFVLFFAIFCNIWQHWKSVKRSKITKKAYRSFCRLLQLQIATIKRKKVEWCAIKMHSNFLQYITKVQTKKNLVHPVLKRVCTEPTKKKEVLQCLALARRKKLQIFKFVTLMEKDGPFC